MVPLLVTLAFAATADGQIAKRLTTVSGARLRAEAKKDGKEIARLPLGTVVDVVSEVGTDWHQVKSTQGDGFLAAALTQPFDAAKKAEIYRQLADARLALKEMAVEEQKDFVDFLARAAAETNDPSFHYDRLLTLCRIVETVDIPGQAQGTFKRWIKKYENEVEFSEPSATYVVSPDALWKLHDANKDRPFAEPLAWKAARSPYPGECEGDVGCYLWKYQDGDAKYVDRHPSGPHVDEALEALTEAAKRFAQGQEDVAKDDLKNLKDTIAKIKAAIGKAKTAKTKPALAAYDALLKAFTARAK